MGRDDNYDQYKKNKSSQFKGLRHLAEWVMLHGVDLIIAPLSIPSLQKLGRAFGRLIYKLANFTISTAQQICTKVIYRQWLPEIYIPYVTKIFPDHSISPLHLISL